eukprot:TRINITY_DN10756_c0_g2_i1.p3 TRINITY_DN10756_c0_g2~~TRINITY_DN10756_c0_g2_i1.p3  ORF type:complete len:108 (-),score=17.05 TRINITY_DN10756_c0_g2_i1:528-851(-)
MTLFVTHYPSLAELAVRYTESITCHHMAFIEVQMALAFCQQSIRGPMILFRQDAVMERQDENDDDDNDGNEDDEQPSPNSSHIHFLYQLIEGLANRSYGLNVARLAR